MMLLFSRAAPASRPSKPLVSVKAGLLIAPKLMQVRRCFSLSERVLAKQLKPEIQGCLINKCTMPGGKGNGGRNKLCGKSSIPMSFFQAQVCARSVPQGQEHNTHQHTATRAFWDCTLLSPCDIFMESIIYFGYYSGGVQKTYQGVTYWVTV